MAAAAPVPAARVAQCPVQAAAAEGEAAELGLKERHLEALVAAGRSAAAVRRPVVLPMLPLA